MHARLNMNGHQWQTAYRDLADAVGATVDVTVQWHHGTMHLNVEPRDGHSETELRSRIEHEAARRGATVHWH